MSKQKINPKKLIEPPGHTLHRLVDQRMQESGERDYQRALMWVVAQPGNLELVRECQNWGRRLSGREP